MYELPHCCILLINELFQDTICRHIMGQSKCGKLMHFGTPTIAYKRMGIYARQQIYWSTKCDKMANDIKRGSDPLKATSDVEYSQLWIGGICNTLLIVNWIFLALLFSGLVDLSALIGRNENEEKIVYLLQSVISVSVCGVKLIPLIACMIVVSIAVNDFAVLDDENCSDPLTVDSMKDASAILPWVLAENCAAFVCDFAQIVIILRTSKKLSYGAMKSLSTGGGQPKQSSVVDESTPLNRA